MTEYLLPFQADEEDRRMVAYHSHGGHNHDVDFSDHIIVRATGLREANDYDPEMVIYEIEVPSSEWYVTSARSNFYTDKATMSGSQYSQFYNMRFFCPDPVKVKPLGYDRLTEEKVHRVAVERHKEVYLQVCHYDNDTVGYKRLPDYVAPPASGEED